MNFNPDMLRIARELRKLNQAELAEKLGLKQVNISKLEAGISIPSDELLNNISQKLQYPTEFFENQIFSMDLGMRLHRKRTSLVKKDEHYIDSLVSICDYFYTRILQFINIEINIPEILTETYKSPSDIAYELREFWNIPKGSIKNLVAYLEKNGVFINEIDISPKSFDAVSSYNTKYGYGIIVINKNQPFDRYRFTLAHELGHIIMHRNSFLNPKERENEANEFASAFLMPEKDIYEDLKNLKFWDLPQYKQIWKVSMSALIRRAFDLGTIDKKKYTYFNVRLSQEGLRQSEPDYNIQKESPSLLKDIIIYLCTEMQLSKREILKFLNLYESDYIEYFNMTLNNNFSPKIVSINSTRNK